MGDKIMQTIENHRISVAIGTVLVVLMSIFGFAYKVGAQQNEIRVTLDQHTEDILENKKSIEKIDERTCAMMELLIEQRTTLEMIKAELHNTRR